MVFTCNKIFLAFLTHSSAALQPARDKDCSYSGLFSKIVIMQGALL
jgi:hypothetical protein